MSISVVMEMGKGGRRPMFNYKLGNNAIGKVNSEKGLGVVIQDNLSVGKHINKITGETYKLVTNMQVVFHHIDEEMMHSLITSMIRPKLEYAVVVWSPHTKKHIRKIKIIQKIAMKIVSSLRSLSYEERLIRLNLPTLEERRERGDLVAIYRTMKGMEGVDREDLFVWDEGPTRGHGKKLKKTRCLKDVKKYSLLFCITHSTHTAPFISPSIHSTIQFQRLCPCFE